MPQPGYFFIVVAVVAVLMQIGADLASSLLLLLLCCASPLHIPMHTCWVSLATTAKMPSHGTKSRGAKTSYERGNIVP